MTLDQLKRIRWAVRATLLLGVAASVVANVLHAVQNPISQSIAAWPPLALLLTVELISRVPVLSRWLGAARIVATAIIAGIAAWVSYWHMVGVASRYGEVGLSPYLLPLSVDGLIVVASICLVELGGRIRGAEQPPAGRMAPADLDPVAEPPVILLDHAAPIGPEPAPAPRSPRRRPRALTVAERVAAAHEKEPAASHTRLAEIAGVSASSVKRHRPTGSPPQPLSAETVIAGGSREPVGARS
jgi:hypothetical protein